MGAMVTLGMMNSLLHEMFEDEDDPTTWLENQADWERERNMLIPNILTGGEGPSLKIPLPYGYNFFYHLGSNLYLMGRQKMGLGQAGKEVAATFLGSFNPLGAPTGKDLDVILGKQFIPTAGKPFVEILANEDYFGQPIYKDLMQSINELFGGNKFEQAEGFEYVDVSPDTVEYLIGFGLGGAGAFVNRSTAPFAKMAKGQKPFEDINDVPFVRRFLHEYTERVDTEAYYRRRDKVEQKINQLKALKTKPEEQRSYYEKNKSYFEMNKVYEKAEKKLSTLRQRQRKIDVAIERNPARAEEFIETQELIQKRMDEIIDTVNKIYGDVDEKNKE